MGQWAWLGMVLLGCQSVSTDEMHSSPLRIATYNINFEREGNSETISTLTALDVDVLFLQETTARWNQVLRRELSAAYPYQVFHDHPPDGGLALLSSLPIEEVAVSPSPVGGFPAWCGWVNHASGPIGVLHVHLHPPVDTSGLLSGYFSTRPLRVREIQAHLSCLGDASPAVIAGDFNEEKGRATAMLRTTQWTDATAPGPTHLPTWHWDTSLFRILGRPDHLFYSNQWTATRVEVIQTGGSDHWPLVASFDIPLNDRTASTDP